MHYELLLELENSMQNHEWLLADYEKFRDREPMDSRKWMQLEIEAQIERAIISKMVQWKMEVKEYDHRTELEIEAYRRLQK